MSLQVRTITAAEHRSYIASRPSVPLQQTPGWGRGFVSARTESIGWFDGGTLVGAGLFRYRGLPRLPMRSVAVFESGPDIDWSGRRRPQWDLAVWTEPLVDHLRDRGVFTARIAPPVVERDWWAVDPAHRATGAAVALRREEPPKWEFTVCTERLEAAGWRPLAGSAGFSAEVPLTARAAESRVADLTASTSVQRGYTVRAGAIEDLAAVQAAVKAAHPGIPQPSERELGQRWRGLAADNLAGVHLVVIEQADRVVYGGLLAVVGQRAWDLSLALPQPDADLPEVQVLRAHVLRRAVESGARSLTVPTVVRERHAPVPAPAPGWPPVHLSRLIGVWQFPVRATWHAALAPLVDRLVL